MIFLQKLNLLLAYNRAIAQSNQGFRGLTPILSQQPQPYYFLLESPSLTYLSNSQKYTLFSLFSKFIKNALQKYPTLHLKTDGHLVDHARFS